MRKTRPAGPVSLSHVGFLLVSEAYHSAYSRSPLTTLSRRISHAIHIGPTE
jgi:hypothetical protein